MPGTRTLLTTAAATVLVASGAGAIAAGTTTTVAVNGVQTLTAGDTSPADVPGVKALRRGKPIPAGYELVGRRVVITKGTTTAGAALRFTCVGSKRLRSFVTTGQAGFQATGTSSYVGKQAVWVLSTPARGATSEGVVYAVCR